MIESEQVFTAKAFEHVKSLIGMPLRQGQAFNEVATADAIRHFAHGYGDVNPLWSNREYASRSKRASIIAPPTFLMSCMGTVSVAVGFPGSHGLWAEDEWIWHADVREGDVISSRIYLTDCQRVYQKFADPMYEQQIKFDFYNQNHVLIAEEIRRVFRFVRHAKPEPAGHRDRYKDMEPWSYTDEEIQRIYGECSRQTIRGSAPLHFEDVKVGDDIPSVVKGPLTITDIIAWKIGCGFPPFIRAHEMRVDYERRHPSSAVKDRYGIPDVPERVHWDGDLAQSNGIPVPFDYGYQRITWLVQSLTNWIGDEGTIRNCRVRFSKPNLLTDTSWCGGKVIGKRDENGKGLVSCEMSIVNQRGLVTTTGHAEVMLPKRTRPSMHKG